MALYFNQEEVQKLGAAIAAGLNNASGMRLVVNVGIRQRKQDGKYFESAYCYMDTVQATNQANGYIPPQQMAQSQYQPPQQQQYAPQQQYQQPTQQQYAQPPQQQAPQQYQQNTRDVIDKLKNPIA